MAAAGPLSTDDIATELTAWGKVVTIVTTGRRTGELIRAAVGYLEEPDGSLLVAAGEPDADWTRNLDANPACQLTLGDRTWPAVAEPLEPSAMGSVVAGLILRYGTPAERLGRGPAYRLRPADR